MGALGWTRFCDNGHIVSHDKTNYLKDGTTICPTCGSGRTAVVFAWGFERQVGAPKVVSTTPIDFEVEVHQSKWRGEEKEQIPVFNVSLLFQSQ